MAEKNLSEIFSQAALQELFPKDRTDDFFDALFGDASEGAYDIELAFKSQEDKQLNFEFLLKQKPGKCLVCSLTYGLPNVFSRHPVINVNGIVKSIDSMLGDSGACSSWKIGQTRELSRELHAIPLTISLT